MQQKPTQKEIQETLKLHSLWLQGSTQGKKADFSGKDLRSADLSGATLRWAILSYANLSGAILRNANLSDANLSDANLRGTNLSSANLSKANLNYADLSDANLSYADLRNADLSKANLRNANLSYANLSSAILSSANLRNANLSYADLTGTKYNTKTKWPAPSMVLLASWGQVSDSLCRDLMRYDASGHHYPKSFNTWKTKGICPYQGVNYQRLANFNESMSLWQPSLLKHPPKSPYSLIMRLLKEKCKKVK
jgi:uncharacterized protein YjbI with pentapeptide repeats